MGLVVGYFLPAADSEAALACIQRTQKPAANSLTR